MSLASVAHAPGLEERPTPFLVIDIDAMEGNIAHMHAFFEGRHSRLRPHVKAHKCSQLARLQLAAGASGVTCSTTDEVRAMAAAGIKNILLANVVLDPVRLESLAESATRSTVAALVDSREAARRLACAARCHEATIGFLVELDIGMNRNGVRTIAEGVRLVDEFAQEPGLSFWGVHAYEGHVVEIPDRQTRAQRALESYEAPIALVHELRGRGIHVAVVTGSSTATYDSTGVLPDMTDVQAGSYLLMDASYRSLTPEFKPALAVVATVVTARPDGDVILDVGAKRLAIDVGTPAWHDTTAVHMWTSEEHTLFRVTAGATPRLGTRVAVIPAHSCSTMAMYRVAFGCRDGQLVRVFEIDARDPMA